MKSVLIAPRNAAREIDPDSPDYFRYLESGSWVRVQALSKQQTQNARTVQKAKQRHLAAGCKKVECFLTPDVYAALLAKKRKGETLAQLIARLVRPDLLGDDQQ